mgnify:CR=1 FL=1
MWYNLINTLISNNTTTADGGGIFCGWFSPHMNLINTTIVNNIIGPGEIFGAGIYNSCTHGSKINLVNSITNYRIWFYYMDTVFIE